MRGGTYRSRNATRLEQLRRDRAASREPRARLAVGLLAGCVIPAATAGAAGVATDRRLISRHRSSDLAQSDLTPSTAMSRYAGPCSRMLASWPAPLLVMLPLVGVIANASRQVGFIFELQRRSSPTSTRLNPLTGFKRLFSMQSLVEPGQVARQGELVGFVALARSPGDAATAADASTAAPIRGHGRLHGPGDARRGIWRGRGAAGCWRSLDYAYQRWEFDASVADEQAGGQGRVQAARRRSARSRRQIAPTQRADGAAPADAGRAQGRRSW